MISTTSWVGQELAGGRYQVTERLGEGGMGYVYRARDRNLDTDVVVKVPRQAVLEDPQFVERFSREVHSLVRLAHPHIVRVTDVGAEGGVPFAVMQYLSGGSLKDRQPRAADGVPSPMPASEVIGWLPGLAGALDFIHAQGYVHRDVKPANVLFDEHGHVYLSDFGVAKALVASAREASTATLTGAGVIVGTPEYMAPELLMGQPFDGRADQYALAVTLYELLSGRRPFEGATPAILLMQQIAAPPAPLHQMCTVITSGVSAVVMKAMSKDPAQRYPSCQSLAQALVAELKRSGTARPTPGPSKAPLVAGSTVKEAVHLPCPACQQPLALTDLARGRRVRCPRCRAIWRVTADLQGLVPASSAEVETPTRTGTRIEPSQGLLPENLLGRGSGGHPALAEVPSRPVVAEVLSGEDHAAASAGSKAWVLVGAGLVFALGLLVLGGLGIAAALYFRQKPDAPVAATSEPRVEPTPPQGTRPEPPPVAGTLVVSQQGQGQFATISEAIRQAQPGARIQVLAGTYSESLVIDKPLELYGEGPAENIVIQADSGSVLAVQSDQVVVVRGLTLCGIAGRRNRGSFAVDVRRGPAEFDGCDITSDSLACVAVHGEGTNPTFRRCKIHDGKAGGILIAEQARARIDHCEISSNGGAGITIRQGANPFILDCRVHDGKKQGFEILDSGRGTLERCEVYGNASAGIEIGRSQAVVRGCKIHDGKGAGLYLYDQTRATVEDCDIIGNGLAGIEMRGGAEPIIRRCRVHSGKQGGILVMEHTMGTIDHCDISGSTYGGVELRDGANPVFRDCKIHDGKTSGVYAHSGGQGRLEDCFIFGNGLSGVSIEKQANPTLTRCKLYDNRNNGVNAYNHGGGLLDDCDIYGNTLAGVAIKQGAHPVLRLCRIYDGKQGGIFAFEGGMGRIESCQIYGNTLANLEISQQSEPSVRDCKIYGGKAGGIYCHSKGGGTFEDSEIYTNTLSGVEIKDASQPLFRHCTFRDGKQTGIYFNIGGQGTIDDCTVFGHAYAAVVVKGGANPTVRKCNLHDNKGAGAYVFANGKVTVEDSTIVNNERAGVEATDGGTVILRKCRVKGNKYQAVWVSKGGGGTVENCDLLGNQRGSFKIDAGCIVRRSGNMEEAGSK